MNTTVRDIAAMPEFKGMKLLAGASGLDNVVTRCGFLDYEYDSALREKYLHRGFDEGEFVLSSFLYAKDNEFYIIDAIKRLHQRGCSGLAIRNIFKLNIRENVLRFADANRFPIFLLTDETFYFEDIVYIVVDRIKKAQSIDRQAGLVDQILFKINKSRESLAREINPSFHDEMAAIFFRPEEGVLSPEDFLSIMSRDELSSSLKRGDSAFYYRNGLMLIHSSDTWHKESVYKNIEKYIDIFSPAFPFKVRCGVSLIHNNLSELGAAVRESLYGSALPVCDERGRCFYHDIGVFRVFIASAASPGPCEFSDGYVRSIKAYDNENNTSLWATAKSFILNNGDIKETALELGQHVNTVRYRLDSISRLLEENVLSKSGYESLSAAIKIHFCREAASLIGF
ncbi:hypothetical protein C4J81_06830 [Deltaproteobacteria bacterium Smac51]|nr:hypothetical protein C4J81_06830 [Deltaproteobacteria bacterium Smac51]